ncbi:MAG: phosphoglucosamine mutase [Clostridia bacterium]|nr:phosphoglucosamine mutase [Clostridia bacterium]
MGRLFGTDGVRGIANRELTAELAFNLGQAGAAVLAGHARHRPQVLIGSDTRISCGMLEAALAAGLCAAGADAVLCGVIPTPGIAALTGSGGYDAGVVISASHNSFEFNGIKFFNADGYKLADAVEDEIEGMIAAGTYPKRPDRDRVGRVRRFDGAAAEYSAHLAQIMGVDLSGLLIAMDCANGAASGIAPALFRSLGANVVVIGNEPDGTNINDNCGSTHLGSLAHLVREQECSIGIAFDGDADRMLAVDEYGDPVDGDVIMAIIADDMRRQGALEDDTLVVTVMSNLGLDIAAGELGIRLEKTKVGDRYVLETMIAGGYSIGGEQSGHIILRDCATTGDGMLSALRLLRALKNRGQMLGQARRIMTVLPQVLKSARIPNPNKESAMADPVIRSMCEECDKRLAGRGRVLVRASGTEPVIRVMLEGEDIDVITGMAEQIAAKIAERHG